MLNFFSFFNTRYSSRHSLFSLFYCLAVELVWGDAPMEVVSGGEEGMGGEVCEVR